MLTDPQADYERGSVPFLDCVIYLDSRPLIPRVETEYWTEQAIKKIQEKGEATCLDLFAGSGAIGVAILKHCPKARVDFGEIDSRHFPTIKKNIEENGIDQARARVYMTDIWSGIQGTYDFICANPPYLSRTQTSRIQDSVKKYEPENALYADDDGFALIEKTLDCLPRHLSTNGIAYIEHEPEHAERIQKTVTHLPLSAETYADQFNLKRYTTFTRTQHD